MRSKPLVLPAALALLAACDQAPAEVEARAPAPAFLPAGAVALPAAPGRSLRDYTWRGTAAWNTGRVPWLGAAVPECLVPGQLGRDELSGLYLTFDAALDAEAGLQPAGWKLESSGVGRGPGRFGEGAVLSARSVLRCEIPAGRPLRAWTIEFWVRAEELAARELLEVPGLLTLACTAEGRLVLQLAGTGDPGQARVQQPTPLAVGVWSHVALVLDREDARGVRVVLDGAVQGRRLDPDQLAAEPSRLVLGDVRGRANGLACSLDELRFEARATSTAELAEHARPAPAPLEHLRLAYAGGATDAALVEEELELWRAPLTDARLDSAEEWARGELVHAGATAAGLAWTSEYWRVVASPDAPVARTAHPVVALGGGRVFTFGGETRDTDLGPTANTNDTWIFDGGTSLWSRIATPLAPSPRCHVPAAYSPDHDLVLLVGGWWMGGWWGAQETRTPQVYGDTWVYHVSAQRWEQRAPQGDGVKLSDHGLVYLPEQRRFLLLQGRRAHLYDPAADTWEHLPNFAVVDESSAPATRNLVCSFCCALDPASGQVLVFGGSYGKGNESFDDATGLYDPRANRFTVLRPPLAPSARVRSGFAYDPVHARFVLFGGVRDQHSQRFDDLWTFEPRTRRWLEVERGAQRPSARGGYYGMAYDEVADRFVLPSGRNASDRWLDETWTLELDERRPGSARYVFDRAAFPAQQTWFAELETPGASGVRFRFKTSADGLRFGEWQEACPPDGRFVQVEVQLLPGAGGTPRVRAMGFRGG